ncbi:MAG: hypothetical protein M3T56_00775 [Chloroflexota bacterium]|nr:hypothetical protein [Chloroflexota bacterium]
MKRLAFLVATVAALLLSSVMSVNADSPRGNRLVSPVSARAAASTLAKPAVQNGDSSDRGGTPGILPATGRARAFYAELQREWWRWDGAFVVSKGHPGLDPTGALCGKKQNGPAWWLETGGPDTERTCHVPAGRLIYLPVAMVICSPLIGYELPPNKLQACASDEFDSYHLELTVTLDGRVVEDVFSYRTQTGVFTLKLPEDNIYAAPGGKGPAAADSVALVLLAPRPGTHVVSLSALVSGTPASFRYILIVGDRGQEHD